MPRRQNNRRSLPSIQRRLQTNIHWYMDPLVSTLTLTYLSLPFSPFLSKYPSRYNANGPTYGIDQNTHSTSHSTSHSTRHSTSHSTSHSAGHSAHQSDPQSASPYNDRRWIITHDSYYIGRLRCRFERGHRQ